MTLVCPRCHFKFEPKPGVVHVPSHRYRAADGKTLDRDRDPCDCEGSYTSIDACSKVFDDRPADILLGTFIVPGAAFRLYGPEGTGSKEMMADWKAADIDAFRGVLLSPDIRVERI